ncbi:hypothetical protein J4Q44_G00008610 [Coregonus suidteri]|uniref:Uncharacterized protein n=1 Tax=Coregonus suidteri TaxID=861788 RepID=A0AAN8MLI1_9TELE
MNKENGDPKRTCPNLAYTIHIFKQGVKHLTTTVKLEDYSFRREEEEELIFILKQQVCHGGKALSSSIGVCIEIRLNYSVV